MNMKRTLRIFFSAVIIRVKRLVSRPVKGQKTWPIRWSENDMVKGIMEKIKRSKYERISLLEETRNSALQK